MIHSKKKIITILSSSLLLVLLLLIYFSYTYTLFKTATNLTSFDQFIKNIIPIFHYCFPWISTLLISLSFIFFYVTFFRESKIKYILPTLFIGLLLIFPALLFLIEFKLSNIHYNITLYGSGISRLIFLLLNLNDNILAALQISEWDFFIYFIIIIPLLFWITNVQLFKGSIKLSKSSITILFIMFIFFILFMIPAIPYGFKWQGVVFTYSVIVINVLFVSVILILIFVNIKKPRYIINLFINFLIFLWFFWIAFPYLGEWL